MINHFIENLMTKINTIATVYYEEAPLNASFPFGVVPTLSLRTLDYGYDCTIDIEFYVNELSDSDVDIICDRLRENLDKYSYQDSVIGYHLSFDDQILSKQKEQDFSYRRMSFTARIF